MATYRKPLKDINGDFIIPAMTGDQTGWVKPADLENGNLYDKFVALDGTEIAINTDLNTIALCKPGMYYCARNVDVATLTNCPTSSAFTMRVYVPNSNVPKDPNVDTWVYTVREITDITNKRWIQRAQQINGVPGTIRCYDWEPITTGEKVDIASTNIDDYSGTLADLVKGIYPAGYHRWYTTINGSVANITDRPAVNGQTGFVMEAFKCRDNTTSDYCYRVVAYSARSNTTDLTDFTYTGYVIASTTSISWLGYAYNTEPNVSPATDTPNDWKARWRYPGRATMFTFYNTAGKFTNQSQQYGWLQTMQDGGNNYTQLWWPFKDKGRVGYRHGNANGWFDSGHTGRFVYLANVDDLYYFKNDTLKVNARYMGCRFVVSSGTVTARFSVVTPKALDNISTITFSAASGQYIECFNYSGTVKSTSGSTNWTFTCTKNSNDNHIINITATVPSPSITPATNTCGTIGITGTFTFT